jgi:hypothetical protein
MPTWTTAFPAPPAELTGLVATADPDGSKVDLVWDVAPMTDALFWRYRVARWNPETGAFDVIGEVADRSAPAYSDLEAPHGIDARYAVTVSNGWAESDAVEAIAFLDLKWWIVNPLEPAMSFELRYVEGPRDVETYQQEELRPLGRRFPVVVSGQLLAPAGSLPIRLLPADEPLRALIRRAALVDPWVVLKNPFGEVRRVKLGSIDRSRAQAGVQLLNLEYRTVA